MDQPSLEQFRASLRGELIQSGDPGYDDARKVYNGMIDKHPPHRPLHRCGGRDRRGRTLPATRGCCSDSRRRSQWRRPGHCDDGLVIDLSAMKGVRVDSAARTARVAGGCIWGDVDHATMPSAWPYPAASSRRPAWRLDSGRRIGYLTRNPA